MLLRKGVKEMDLREFIEGQSKEDSGNKKSLINISNLVVRLLSKETLKIPRYTAAGLKLNDLFFDEARDLIHNKLTMRYKAMIKKELM